MVSIYMKLKCRLEFKQEIIIPRSLLPIRKLLSFQNCFLLKLLFHLNFKYVLNYIFNVIL